MNETEAWLAGWHARFPGATSRCCAHGQPSSYEWLASRVRPGERVLDVGCGDGFLLERLGAPHVGSAVGLDLSAAELAAARQRLGDHVELVRGRAQDLPFSRASFDTVVSHLALMLLQPVEPALAEIDRVLRPGGRLLAVVGASTLAPREDAWTALVHAFMQLPPQGPPMGDPEVGLVEPLRAKLSRFEHVRVEPMRLDLSGPPARVWDLLEHTYLFAMVPDDRRESFVRTLRSTIDAMTRADGTVPCALDLLTIEAVRPT